MYQEETGQPGTILHLSQHEISWLTKVSGDIAHTLAVGNLVGDKNRYPLVMMILMYLMFSWRGKGTIQF